LSGWYLNCGLYDPGNDPDSWATFIREIKRIKVQTKEMNRACGSVWMQSVKESSFRPAIFRSSIRPNSNRKFKFDRVYQNLLNPIKKQLLFLKGYFLDSSFK